MGQSSAYKPFPTTYGNWVYRYFDDFGMPMPYQKVYTLFGDTTISNMNYKKISDGDYVGALRESSKRIYFIPDTSLTEYLLYDFNLSVGDTVANPFGGAVCSNDTVILEGMDSVLVSDGYHRQYNWLPPSGVNWIEGIGSYNYLLAPNNILCVSGNLQLVCMISDGTFIYPATWSGCSVSVPEMGNQTMEILVFPNPSAGSFTVDFNGLDVEEVVISDPLGKVVLRQRTNGRANFQVDDLSSGMYLLSAVDASGSRVYKRIVNYF